MRRSLRRQRRSVLASSALITLWQVCEAMVTVLIGLMIDRAVTTGDLGQLLLWAGVLCLHFLVLSLSYRFGARIGNRAVHVESHRLRTEVSAHVLDPRGARTDRLSGDLLALATGDADLVGEVIRQVALSVAGAIGLVVSGVVLAVIDPWLALIVLVGVPLVLGATHLVAPGLAQRSARRQEALGRTTGVATDLIRGIRPLKGIGGVEVALERYRRESRTAAHTSVAAAGWAGLLTGITSLGSGVFLAVIAVVAGLRTLSGDLSVGELVAVVGLAQFVAEPMRMLSALVARVAQSRASAARIVAFLSTPALVTEGERPADGHHLELDHVSAGPVTDLSLAVPPGRLVAVVANDPAVPATLLSLLHGESSPERGKVLLGDEPITELALSDVRRRLLVTDHQVDLFEGTLRSNVDPLERHEDVRVEAVLAAASATELVAVATEGLATHVAVDGQSLSGGQRQRLGLARALAADAPVLVLHDPTTAVDAVTEQHIAGELRRLRHGSGSDRATLLFTSSPLLLAEADEVVWVGGDQTVVRGTHDQLADDAAYCSAVLR